MMSKNEREKKDTADKFTKLTAELLQKSEQDTSSPSQLRALIDYTGSKEQEQEEEEEGEDGNHYQSVTEMHTINENS